MAHMTFFHPLRRHSLRPGASLFMLIIVASIAASGCSTSQPAVSIDPGLRAITPEYMQSQVDILASDAMMGRNTPSPGLDSAAQHIARELDRLGIGGCKGTRFQSLNMATVRLTDDNHLRLLRGGETNELAIKSGYIPYEITANGRATGQAVFVGYGITAPEYGYDDYAGIDVRGKVVLALRHEPGENDTASVFNGRRMTTHSSVETKVANARAHGAVGVILLSDPLNHINLRPSGYPWPSLYKTLSKDAIPTITGIPEEDKLPVVHAGDEFITAVFGSVDSLRRIQKRIDATLRPASSGISGLTIDLRTSTEVTQLSASNVVGFLEGSDPDLRNDVLVIGAHYDHVGFRKQHADGEDFIMNGADDNASGTAGVLTLARAFAAMNARPRRSVLFLLFAAEERGLVGSETYVNHPLFPLDRTVAMLNLDMISRNGEDTLFIVDSTLSPALYSLTMEENTHTNFTMARMGRSLFGGSDHMSFFREDVPVMFFFTGLHKDYHQVSDNPDTINPRKAARVTELVFRTAWRIVNDDAVFRPAP